MTDQPQGTPPSDPTEPVEPTVADPQPGATPASPGGEPTVAVPAVA